MICIDKVLSEKEIDDLVKEIMSIPVEKNNNDCLSSYGSINVDDLIETVKKLKKVPTYNELLKENKQLKEKYNEALKQLIRYNIPCEIDGFNEKDENIEYCSENCGVDDNIYFKCWDRFIEQELDKGE